MPLYDCPTLPKRIMCMCMSVYTYQHTERSGRTSPRPCLVCHVEASAFFLLRLLVALLAFFALAASSLAVWSGASFKVNCT